MQAAETEVLEEEKKQEELMKKMVGEERLSWRRNE